MFWLAIGVAALLALPAFGQRMDVRIPFRAVAGAETVVCGRALSGFDTPGVRLRDLRFYVYNVRLFDDRGHEAPVELTPSPWQYEDAALLDFEDGTGGCSNGARAT